MPQYNDFKTWDEVFKYTYDNGDGLIFVPYEENGRVNYYWERDPKTIIEWSYLADNTPAMFNQYETTGINPKYPHMGPPAPELPPLIKKIRAMHMRQTFSWG